MTSSGRRCLVAGLAVSHVRGLRSEPCVAAAFAWAVLRPGAPCPLLGVVPSRSSTQTGAWSLAFVLAAHVAVDAGGDQPLRRQFGSAADDRGAGRHRAASGSACSPRTCTSARPDAACGARRSSPAREAARNGARGFAAAPARPCRRIWSGRCRGRSARRCSRRPARPARRPRRVRRHGASSRSIQASL